MLCLYYCFYFKKYVLQGKKTFHLVLKLNLPSYFAVSGHANYSCILCIQDRVSKFLYLGKQKSLYNYEW